MMNNIIIDKDINGPTAYTSDTTIFVVICSSNPSSSFEEVKLSKRHIRPFDYFDFDSQSKEKKDWEPKFNTNLSNIAEEILNPMKIPDHEILEAMVTYDEDIKLPPISKRSIVLNIIERKIGKPSIDEHTI